MQAPNLKTKSVAALELHIVFAEIQLKLKQSARLQEACAHFLKMAGEVALHLGNGSSKGGFGSGVDHFTNGFGLQKVDSAAEESTAGEFSGFGEPASAVEKGLQKVAHNNGTAVAGELDHIFHGEGGGSPKNEGDDFIHHSTAV